MRLVSSKHGFKIHSSINCVHSCYELAYIELATIFPWRAQGVELLFLHAKRGGVHSSAMWVGVMYSRPSTYLNSMGHALVRVVKCSDIHLHWMGVLVPFKVH